MKTYSIEGIIPNDAEVNDSYKYCSDYSLEKEMHKTLKWF